ncbi:hypothetical protein TTRE_0000275201 [Trichuris trichiura]|uniref:EGF-like domain-containing protein n=1 Tax=Trichuris trichiura TaxID=36087 RepID=A0A077Z1U6_TRITR|nr:hypothetical protein TTRE_0000275201 [Trichuris trichiura]
MNADIVGYALPSNECLSFISVNNVAAKGSGDELEIYNNFCSTRFKGGHVARFEAGIAFPRSTRWLRNYSTIRVYSGVQLIGTELKQYREEFGWFQIGERPFFNFRCSENPIRYATWLELPVSVVFRCVHPLKVAFQIFLYKYWSSAWIRDYSHKIEEDDKLFRQLTGYPKCRLLLIKKSGHFSFTELQPCRDAKWSHFACRHYASTNCRRERLQLCHSSNLFQGCKSFAYKTVQQPEPPYGHSCKPDDNGPSCHCSCANSAWLQWSPWSSTCGIAERFRKGLLGNGTAEECDRNISTCCHQMERKVYSIRCSSYIFNTGIHILNATCLNNGTITKHWQNGVFCKCLPLFTGPVCDTSNCRLILFPFLTTKDELLAITVSKEFLHKTLYTVGMRKSSLG